MNKTLAAAVLLATVGMTSPAGAALIFDAGATLSPLTPCEGCIVEELYRNVTNLRDGFRVDLGYTLTEIEGDDEYNRDQAVWAASRPFHIQSFEFQDLWVRITGTATLTASPGNDPHTETFGAVFRTHDGVIRAEASAFVPEIIGPQPGPEYTWDEQAGGSWQAGSYELTMSSSPFWYVLQLGDTLTVQGSYTVTVSPLFSPSEIQAKIDAIRARREAVAKAKADYQNSQTLAAFGSSVSPVPLPASVWLLGSGLAALGLLKRKRAV